MVENKNKKGHLNYPISQDLKPSAHKRRVRDTQWNFSTEKIASVPLARAISQDNQHLTHSSLHFKSPCPSQQSRTCVSKAPSDEKLDKFSNGILMSREDTKKAYERQRENNCWEENRLVLSGVVRLRHEEEQESTGNGAKVILIPRETKPTLFLRKIYFFNATRTSIAN